MQKEKTVQVAILDDYQGVALKSADWSSLNGKAILPSSATSAARPHHAGLALDDELVVEPGPAVYHA